MKISSDHQDCPNEPELYTCIDIGIDRGIQTMSFDKYLANDEEYKPKLKRLSRIKGRIDTRKSEHLKFCSHFPLLKHLIVKVPRTKAL